MTDGERTLAAAITAGASVIVAALGFLLSESIASWSRLTADSHLDVTRRRLRTADTP